MNYYNEWDKHAAQWLRNLIAAKLIPAGEVDERDIREVRPEELDSFHQCHFFAGIAGWPLALQLSEWSDEKEVWTGSCPCQPFSTAGKARGLGDERHLWPAFHRLIAECHPPIVFGEQVAGADGRAWLAGVRLDLERVGYAVGAADLCAASVGAPHIRQRLYWVAHADIARYHGWTRSGEQSLRQQNESLGGMADSQTSERGGADGAQEQGRRLEKIGGSSPACWLGEPDSPRRINGQSSAQTSRHGSTIESTSDSVRMGSPIRTGLEGQPGNGDGGDESRRLGAKEIGSACQTSKPRFWDAYDLIPCTDGKSRRVEPGTFPLAHGVPARMVKLRAYGNAIVPQVAAEFVRAYLGARP